MNNEVMMHWLMLKKNLENYILQSNATHKICGKYKHTKHIKLERHRYTWFTQFGLRPPRTASPSFILSNKMKRHNLQQIRCNILCSLSQSPYLFLSLRIHIQYTAAITCPHTIKGFPSRAKNPKRNITSTIRSPPNEWPRLTRNYYTFTRKFYICF